MKIVQVIHGFPPFNTAGSEVYCYLLSKELSRRGHEVTVFHRVADPGKDEYATEWAEHDGLRVFRINNNFKNCPSFEWTYRNETIAKKFGAFLDEVKPDAVHFHHVTCLSTTCIEEAKKRGVQVVYTLHDYWLICQRGQFLKRDLSICERQEDSECVQCLAYQLRVRGGAKKVSSALKNTLPSFQGSSYAKELLRKGYLLYAKLFFKGQKDAAEMIRKRRAHVKEMCSLVDTFIAPSRFLMGKFTEFGIPGEKIIYSDYGFDTSLFKGVERKAGERIRFGYIGTWIPSKGVHVLIDAFNRVANDNAELVIYGKYLPYDGVKDYLGDLKRLVKNERIKLAGEYRNSDIGNILSGVDVLVVPSIWYENSPLTIHEAFLARVPVIASGTGGMAEYVKDGVNGLLFKVGSAADLYTKIETVIDDPSVIARLREGIPGIKTIEENAREIEALYSVPPTVEIENRYDFLSNIVNAEVINSESGYGECPYADYNFKDFINTTAFAVNGEERDVLFEHPSVSPEDPSSTVLFKDIRVGEGDALVFGIGINEGAWGMPGDGVEFEAFVEEEGVMKTIFSKYIDPKNNPSDRRWFDEEVRLSAFEGKTVNVLFKTSAGPRGNPEFDWAGWSAPAIVNGTVKKYDFTERLGRAFIVKERKERLVREEVFYKLVPGTRLVSYISDDDSRQVVSMKGSAEVVYRGVRVPLEPKLKLGIGAPLQKGSAELEISARTEKGEKKVFSKSINLINTAFLHSRNQRWLDEEVDIKDLAGETADFHFKVKSSGNMTIGLGPAEIVSKRKRTVRRPAADHTNILLITLDAVRADHLGCMGNARTETPNLDRIAGEGVLFKSHFTQANLTVPSHVSLLSSKFPRTLRVLDNHRYTLPPLGTLPERLSERGYAGTAVVSVELLNPDWCKGIENGFSRYFPVMGKERTVGQAKNIFMDWLLENSGSPFFAWMHLFDAHYPYLPPRPFYKRYYSGNERDAGNDSVRAAGMPPQIMNWLRNRKITDINFPISQYAASVSYVDSVLGGLFKDLERLGLLDSTVIIVTSDHGECFGEHGVFFDHQGLYDEAVHIPLIMRYPGALPEGRVVEGLSMNIDIVPTVLDILGMEAGGLEGRSLLPLIKSEAESIHDHVVSELIYGRQVALRTRKWKYIKSLEDMGYSERFSVKKGKVELYDLEADPGELCNVAGSHPDVARDFEEKLARWLEEREGGERAAEKLDEDEETRKKLEALGYF